MAKQADVKVGEVWTCRVGARIVQVRLTGEVEGRPKGDRFSLFPGRGGKRASFIATNLATGRSVKVTAAKLRRKVKEANGTIAPEEAMRRLRVIEAASGAAESSNGGNVNGDDPSGATGPGSGQDGDGDASGDDLDGADDDASDEDGEGRSAFGGDWPIHPSL